MNCPVCNSKMVFHSDCFDGTYVCDSCGHEQGGMDDCVCGDSGVLVRIELALTEREMDAFYQDCLFNGISSMVNNVDLSDVYRRIADQISNVAKEGITDEAGRSSSR